MLKASYFAMLKKVGKKILDLSHNLALLQKLMVTMLGCDPSSI